MTDTADSLETELGTGWEPPATGPYWSRSATDAHESGAYESHYVDYLEIAALRHHIYFLRHGDPVQADLMMTRSFSESLIGNDGE